MSFDERESRRRPELVIALVGAAGTDLEAVAKKIGRALSPMRYRTEEIRLSALLHEVPGFESLRGIRDEADRISEHQKAGNRLRELTKRGEAVALLAVAAMRRVRKQKNSLLNRDDKEPLDGVAFIVRSLKTRAEVDELRRVYGDSLVVLGVHSSEETRRNSLAQAIALSKCDPNHDAYMARAQELLAIDQEEPGNAYGQDVRHAYPESDVFVAMDAPSDSAREIERFFRLYFGNQFVTPTPDEFAMFLAHAVALRSADLSRQVGAVIATKEGDVVAVGCNEVPKAGGGQYLDGDPNDARDFRLDHNMSAQYRRSALAQVLDRLAKNGWLSEEYAGKSAQELSDKARDLMRGTQLMGSGEYGRMVHAEMAALTDAARRGVATRELRLVTNVFPCHNCTKHIVAAGIQEVVFLHPYPKSLALQLHRDSVELEPAYGGDRVAFRPFAGVGPRQYMSLFKMTARKEGDEAAAWRPETATPRQWKSFTAVVECETAAFMDLQRALKNAGLQWA